LSEETTAPGGTATVEASVSGFEDVTTAQFSVDWDPSIAAFGSVGGFDLPGLDGGNFGTPDDGSISDGTLTFSWDDPEAEGVTVSDGTVIFELQLDAVGAAGEQTALSFTDDPTTREVTVDFEIANFDGTDGSIVVDALPIQQARQQGPGSTVTVEGTVTRAFGSYVRLQDESGPTGASGLVVRQTDGSLSDDFQQDIENGDITQGTLLQVAGTLSEFNGLLQVNNGDLDDYTVQEQGSLPAVQEVSFSVLQTDGEDYESELVRVETVLFEDPSATGGTLDAQKSYNVEDGDGTTFTYRVQGSSETAVIGAEIPNETFTYEGVVGQFSDSYQLIPVRSSSGLPVEMAGFEATVDGDAVRLTWQTASETNNARFEVQRRSVESRRDGSTSWKTIGSVEGAGTTTEAKSYGFTDDELPFAADRLDYRLRQVDIDGSTSLSETVTVERGVSEVELLRTHPNPVRSDATIRYALPETRDVTIRLYNVLGQQVRTVANAKQKGRHEQRLDASGLPSGTYFLWLEVGGQTRTQQLTVVR
jgi:hypothetical protein